MDITSNFLIYAAIFRLAVLAVGATAIVLGYRLFQQAIEGNKQSVTAQGETWKVNLRNLGPGLYFAAFGTWVIVQMLAHGMPEMSWEQVQQVASQPAAEAKTGTDSAPQPATPAKITMRNNSASECLANNDVIACWEAFQAQITDPSAAAELLAPVAKSWQQEGRIQEALAIARLAATLDKNNADRQVEFARLLEANQQTDLAVQVLESAVKIDERYRNELEDLRKRLGQ